MPRSAGAAPVWLFDLDNTLHDASRHIFPRINRAMTDYIVDHLTVDVAAANRLRQIYWERYGATLTGLVRHHGVDPQHFLHATHQFPDLPDILHYDRAARHWLSRLPGRKVLFSNAPRRYALAVLRAMRIAQHFEAVYAIETLRFRPKPQTPAYLRLLADLRVPARRCIFVEDSVDNLRPAKALGMTTVWVSACTRQPAFVDVKVRQPRELIERFRGNARV